MPDAVLLSVIQCDTGENSHSHQTFGYQSTRPKMGMQMLIEVINDSWNPEIGEMDWLGNDMEYRE